MVTISTPEDLLRALRENPEWKEAVRREILTEQLLNLPARFDQFAASTEGFIEEQRQFNAETGGRVDRLESDVGQLKEDVGQLKEDVGQLKEDVGELKQDVGQLKEDVGELKQDVGQLKNDVRTIRDDLGRSKGVPRPRRNYTASGRGCHCDGFPDGAHPVVWRPRQYDNDSRHFWNCGRGYLKFPPRRSGDRSH